MLRPQLFAHANPWTDPERQIAYARSVLVTEGQALIAVADRLDEQLPHAVAHLADCEGSVLAMGMGKSGWVAQKVVATLASTGTRAHFLHPAEAVHGDLGRLAADDVVLAFSHSGETAEIVRILPTIHDRGAPVIAVTGRGVSTLARAAVAAIVYGPVEEACPLNLAPSTSCTAMMAIGDALAFTLMQLRGFGHVEFERVHPSGALGRLLQPVDAVMRAGGRMRLASATLTVREAFVAAGKPGRRTGAIMLVDEAGRFMGLFTDSDLARIVEKQEWSRFDHPMTEVMTKDPVVLRRRDRVADALRLLRERRLSEIPVLDDDQCPVGIVDITDLVDLLPEQRAAA